MLCGELNGKEIQETGEICLYVRLMCLHHLAVKQKLIQQHCKETIIKNNNNTIERGVCSDLTYSLLKHKTYKP